MLKNVTLGNPISAGKVYSLILGEQSLVVTILVTTKIHIFFSDVN